MKMKRILYFLIVAATALLGATPASAQSLEADRRLRAASDRFFGSGSVTMDFNAYMADEGSIAGTATFSGPCFKLDTPALTVWFDGTTQWTLLRASNEVNITEPLPEEIAQTNPFVILSAYSNTFRARRLPDSAGAVSIELTPIDASASEIARAVIFIGSDGWITGAKVTFADGRELTARASNIVPGAAIPQSQFRFNAADAPGAAVVDLR